MHVHVTMVVFLGLGCGTAPAEAAVQEAALAVIEKAIKAHGGEEALLRSQRLSREAKGFLILGREKVPSSEHMVWHLPDRWRRTAELQAGEQRLKLVLVVNGENGWRIAGETGQELNKQELSPLREEMDALWLATLVPLKKKTGLELGVLPESKVNGLAAIGVKVSRRGLPDVKLYFDRCQTAIEMSSFWRL